MKRFARLAPPAILVFFAFGFAVLYLLVSVSRITYPYDLDFIEDSMLMQSWQFARGLPVFAAPNAEFVPHQYMPLYSWLGGLLLRVTGPEYLALRLLSFASVAAAAALLFWVARRESGTIWLGIVCAGLYLAGYRLTGQWYELVRVDSLYLALSLGGIALVIYSEGRNWRMFAAAVLLALAFWTKQTALLYGIGFALYVVVLFGRRVVWFLFPYAVLTIGAYGLVDQATGGWFWFHTVTVSSSDPVEVGRAVRFVTAELFGVMAGVTLLALGATALVVRNWWHGTRSLANLLRAEPWLIAIAMGVIVSAAGRASVGGNLNNLLSAYTLLCLAPALFYKHALAARSPQLTALRTPWIILALVLFQFALGAYNPFRYMPDPAMRTAGDNLIQRIAASEGNVYVMMHPYYAVRAGKPPSAQVLTIWYMTVRGGLPLPQDLVERFRTKYYSTIISDETPFETDPVLSGLLNENYERVETLPPELSPATNTGVVSRPMSIYRPRP
jgi:hypothetical protein